MYTFESSIPNRMSVADCVGCVCIVIDNPLFVADCSLRLAGARNNNSSSSLPPVQHHQLLQQQQQQLLINLSSHRAVPLPLNFQQQQQLWHRQQQQQQWPQKQQASMRVTLHILQQ